MNRWTAPVAAALAAAALAPAAPAGAAVVAGPVRLASVAPNGALIRFGTASAAAVSGNGRLVAFDTAGPSVVPGDVNGGFDVFLRDLTAKTTVPVSVTPSGRVSNGSSSGPSLSGDGRLITFGSNATDLTADPVTGNGDIYVRDLVAGRTRLVSRPQAGGVADAFSTNAALSGSGRYVAFSSFASNLVPGVPGVDGSSLQVFRADLTTGQVVLVSVTAGGVVGNNSSTTPELSFDGRYVLFNTDATNFGPADPNGQRPDYYRKDLVSGRLDLVSRTPAGTTGNDQSFGHASISGDGNLIAFQSNASDLVPGTAGVVYLRDMRARTTTVGSRRPDGTVENGGEPSLSADGRLLAYEGFAGPPGAEVNGIVVRDLVTGQQVLTATGVGGTAPNGAVLFPELSGNGRRVVFVSDATNLVPNRSPVGVFNAYATALSLTP